jgi:hypothetical protein
MTVETIKEYKSANSELCTADSSSSFHSCVSLKMWFRHRGQVRNTQTES